ncbi:MAG: tetratricopeptide repeat protein [Methanotrichaceae archaeon]
MKNKDNLAKLEHAHHGLPETSHCKFKIIFCLIPLTILCTYAMAQENTSGYWLKKGDELRQDFLREFYQINHASHENVSIWLDKNQESIKAYESVLEITNETLANNPQDAVALQNRGAALASLGYEDAANKSYEKAIEAYNQSISRNSTNISALLSKADLLRILGRSEAALEAYDDVIALNPTNATGALVRKFDILFELGKYNESAEAFDKIADLLSNDNSKMAASAGLNVSDNQYILIQGGNRARNISAFMRDNHTGYHAAIWSEKGNKTTINVWYYKGQILRISFNRYNESNRSYDLYMQIDSSFVDYWRDKELSVRSRLDDYRNVLNDYKRAIEIINKTAEASR